MLGEAEKRNKVALPKVERSYGVQLPPEKYCLTGIGWNLKDEWESDEDIKEEEESVKQVNGVSEGDDVGMSGMDGLADEDEEGVGRMEDVFGNEDGEDTEMS